MSTEKDFEIKKLQGIVSDNVEQIIRLKTVIEKKDTALFWFKVAVVALIGCLTIAIVQ